MLQGLHDALTSFLEAVNKYTKWRAMQDAQKKYERALARAFLEQGRIFVKKFAATKDEFPAAESSYPQPAASHYLQETITDDDWIDLFDEAAEETYTEFLRPTQAAMSVGLQKGAAQIIEQVAMNITFNLSNPRAVAYVEQNGAALVAQVNDTTRDYIKTVCSQAAREGWDYNRTAAAITERYHEFAVGRPQEHIDSRAHGIAIQELSMAYEDGSAIVVGEITDAGVQLEKSWLTVGDDRVSEICSDNEDEGWIPVDQLFSSGAEHAPGHVYCRCTTLYRRVSDDE